MFDLPSYSNNPQPTPPPPEIVRKLLASVKPAELDAFKFAVSQMPATIPERILVWLNPDGSTVFNYESNVVNANWQEVP